MTDEKQVRDVLQQVKQYITAKEYDKARELLLTIDHPKREEWLQRLAQSKQQQKADNRPKPWNPGWFSAMAIIMTPLVSSFILAWNWRRFGKKEWVLPTIMGYIAILTVLITSFGILPNLAGRFEGTVLAQRYFAAAIIVLLAMANFFYPFYIGGQQGRAYKLMQQKGLDAALSYQYNWGRGTLFYIGEILIFGIGTLLFVWYQAQPQTFDDGWFQVTYPGNWEAVEVSELEQCRGNTYLDCRLVIQKGTYSGIALLVASIDTNNTSPGTAAELGKFYWQSLEENPDFEPLAQDRYQFAGLDGYYVTYLNDTYRLTDIFVVDGVEILYISISGYSEKSLADSWEQIEDILNSIQLH